MSTPEHGPRLLRLARETILHRLGGPHAEEIEEAWSTARGATFVTLTKRGRLHGCIGSIEATRSLAEDVKHNALAAAFSDPRSFPLRKDEIDDLRIEISLLSPLTPIAAQSEGEAIAEIRPHVDGLVLRSGLLRSTFLPQVWKKLPSPADFLAELKMKAGLSPAGWPEGAELSRFSVVEKWCEPGAPPESSTV